MNKLFRPYLTFLLMGAMLAFSACKDDDDPDPTDDGEVITTVRLSLIPDGKGQDAEATIRTTTGTPVQDIPLTLKANTRYNAVITLSDESKSPVVDVTAEIQERRDEHLFVYSFTSETGSPAPTVDVTITDTDRNNRPVGLLTTIATGANTGTGKLRVILKHQPGNLKTGTNQTAGESDVDVNFNVIIN